MSEAKGADRTEPAAAAGSEASGPARGAERARARRVSRSGRWRGSARWIVGGLFLLLLAFIVLSSASLGDVRCEVTTGLNGRTAEASARGPTEQDAMRAAITNACSRIARGRTENIRCLDTPPMVANCR